MNWHELFTIKECLQVMLVNPSFVRIMAWGFVERCPAGDPAIDAWDEIADLAFQAYSQYRVEYGSCANCLGVKGQVDGPYCLRCQDGGDMD